MRRWWSPRTSNPVAGGDFRSAVGSIPMRFRQLFTRGRPTRIPACLFSLNTLFGPCVTSCVTSLHIRGRFFICIAVSWCTSFVHCFQQIIAVNSVIAAKHRLGLVPGDGHNHVVVYSGPSHARYKSVPQVMETEIFDTGSF